MKRTPNRVLKTRNIGIVGLGLIGASLAKRLINSDPTLNIIGVDNDSDTLRYAFTNQIVHLGHTDMRILRGCEVVFVATPMDIVADIAGKVFDLLGRDAIITDVAGIKGEIVSQLPKGIRFVGGHPMAGAERGGIREAKEHLFENAYYVLCGGEDADVEVIEALVKNLGAKPIRATTQEHDKVVARVSHLPHYIAYALSTASAGALEYKLGATSFKDMTRVAESDPIFWCNAARLNKENVLIAMDGFLQELGRIRAAVEGNNFEELTQLLDEGRSHRRNIEILKFETFALTIDVKDKPNTIGKIASNLGAKGINIKNIAVFNSREGTGGALRLQFEDEESKNRARAVLSKHFVVRD